MPQDVVASEAIDALIAHLAARCEGRPWLKPHRPRAARRAGLRHHHRQRSARERRRTAEGDVPGPPLRHRHRRTVAKAQLPRLVALARCGRAEACRDRRPGGRSDKVVRASRDRGRRHSRCKARARRHHPRARRRRDRRPRRLCGIDRAPWHGFRPDPDLASGAGRLLRRRQDRHQRAAGQEPRRRLPPAQAGARRSRRARDAARRASSRRATPRW